MHDVVIRGGFLVDGTGAPGREADVAIDGDLVVAVGDVGRGRREIDARGLLVTPGFVDMHTHYDGQVTWDPYLTPSGWHGCTTVVMGNCGVGFAPVRLEDRDWLINVMEGVEDIPGSALHEGIRWAWETFPEYLDAIEALPHAIDFGTQVPHSALRAYVMGRRAEDPEAYASPEEIARMSELVEEALRAGALGFSTSRTPLHKTAEGVLVAGTFAARQELLGIGDALGRVGTGVFEVASEHTSVPTELSWMKEIATRTGRPVIFNLSQLDQAPGLWRSVLDELEAFGRQGIPVYGQVAGRAIGILMNWRCTAHPFALKPSFQALATRTWAEQLQLLRDPAFRRRLIDEEAPYVGDFEAYVTQSWHKMFPLGTCNYEPSAEQSVAALATASGRSPAEVAYDELMRSDGEAFLYFPLFNYADGSYEPLHALHSSDRTFMGLSDGGAHCGAICDAGMPTFMLTYWTRDRSHERIPLERIIRRQTRDTAHLYGMRDRGIVAPGYLADLNVIDYDRLGLEAPRLAFDLPAGGRRLLQRARGYRYTLKRGRVIVESDVPTNRWVGRLVRGPQPAPAHSRPDLVASSPRAAAHD